MEIVLAEHAGFCYGVERSLKLLREAQDSINEQPIATLGHLIHSPQVVDQLRKEGIRVIEDISQFDHGILVIRCHGVGPEILQQAEDKGIQVIDATCPFVKKAQLSAAKLIDESYKVLILGERRHPEVIGILAHTGNKAIVIESLSDVPEQIGKRVGVVVQTTQSPDILAEITANLSLRVFDLRVCNTICHATTQRQNAARRLAKKADVMLVVGGKISANTKRLAAICRAENVPTYQIETAGNMEKHWFENMTVVGVAAGASTPDYLLQEVIKKCKSFSKAPDPEQNS